MNELIFFIYIFSIVISTSVALRIGKEALISLICLETVLSNLFVTKSITLFGLQATASDSFAVGITLGLNLLQEYFSFETARKTIWISFFCSCAYALFTLLHLTYVPSITDVNSIHFQAILTPTARIIAASLSVYVFVQYLDSYIYRTLRRRLSSNYFTLRNYISLAISQFIDTVLFSFLGLYAINESFSSMQAIIEIIAISYIIKLIAIIISAPLLSFSKKIIA